MANTLSLLESREKGILDISIGTDLGIQGACGLSEDGKVLTDPPIAKYDVLLINVRTLYRNIQSLLDKEAKLTVHLDDMITVLMSEVQVINSAIQRYSNNKTQVKYYACDYNSLTKLYKFATFKEATTDTQLVYSQMENKVIEKVIEQMKTLGIPFYHFDTTLNLEEQKRTLIITHYAVDLLSYHHFNGLHLLETHTGKIKTPAEWNTKLKGGKDLSRIPFDKMTIQMFGDSGGLIQPQPIKFRQALQKIAEKHKWNSTTTKSRVLLTVNTEHIADLEAIVRQMYM